MVDVVVLYVASEARQSVEKGVNPRDFAFVPYGGAGPDTANALVRTPPLSLGRPPYYRNSVNPAMRLFLKRRSAFLADASRTILLVHIKLFPGVGTEFSVQLPRNSFKELLLCVVKANGFMGAKFSTGHALGRREPCQAFPFVNGLSAVRFR